MISCTETILVYNEFFLFLEERHGRQAVETYWHFVADTAFDGPRAAIREGGLDAVYDYLRETWGEEGDVFDIERDETSVRVTVHNCSSVRKLRKAKHITRYADYCGHCPVMYARLFDDLGYDFEMDRTDPEKGICSVRVSRRPES
ncbi:MAG: hypothetical protein V2A58_17470 [Planctomycetota bacterium]